MYAPTEHSNDSARTLIFELRTSPPTEPQPFFPKLAVKSKNPLPHLNLAHYRHNTFPDLVIELELSLSY
ncbi:hypothetical protein LguiB_024184 [Lonicera macranthoides]